MSVYISGVPFNTANPVQDGRIVGGNPGIIDDHPHQVNLNLYGCITECYDIHKR